MVHQLGLDECVHLVDEYVPNEDVAPLFALADVVALPYRSASQSGVLPIAATLRKPVVATQVGGLPEALAGTGLLVPPSDPAALGDALVLALENPPAPPPVVEDAWAGWERALEAVILRSGSAVPTSRG
jgi:glycosyltransferase involved in cell wall biosynthesis